MPNHVTNVIAIDDLAGISLAEVRAKFINGKGHVDFNVIKPAPACLDGFEPHSGILSRAEAALGLLPDPATLRSGDLKGITKRLHLSNALRDVTTRARHEDVPGIVRAIFNYHSCGYMYWHDWNTEHWGTKWNAYNQPQDGHPADAMEYHFDTAWSHPRRLIECLSASLPGVDLSVRYADEDIGANCGRYRIKSGSVREEELAPRRDDQTEAERRRWAEFAFRLCHAGSDPASFGYDANWKYSDEVYEAHERQAASQ